MPPMNEIQCLICFDTTDEPVLSACCKKMICGDCKLKITLCPFCRAPFSTIPTPKDLLELLSKLQSCPYKSRGCRSKMEQSEIAQHISSCDYRPATCPNVGCDFHQENFLSEEEFPNYKAVNPKEHQCKSIRMTCNHCKQQYFSGDGFIHMKKCTKVPRQTLSQSDIYSHTPLPSTHNVRIENWESISLQNTWESEPFTFNNFPNYKFVFFLFPHGFREGSGTHVSVYLRVVPGEYDDQLTWPCAINNFKITLEKQRVNGKSLSGTFTVPHLHDMLKKKTVDSKSGYGYAKFIPIADPRFKNTFIDDAGSVKFTIEATIGRPY